MRRGIIFAAKHLAWAVPRAITGAELFFGSFFLVTKKRTERNCIQDKKKGERK
jgi:hypothetical protein